MWYTRSSSWKSALLLASLLTLVSMVGYVWMRMASIESSRLLARLETTQVSMMEENARLRVDVVYLMRGQSICALASEKLGMVFPKRLPVELSPSNEEIR